MVIIKNILTNPNNKILFILLIAILLILVITLVVKIIQKNKKESKLENAENGRKMSDKEIFKRLISYIIPYKKTFIIAFIIMIIMVGFNLIIPLGLNYAIIILSKEAIVFRHVIYLVLAGAVIILASAVLSYYETMILQKVGQKIIYEIRTETFFHIEKLSIAQINKIPVGKLVTRVTNDTAYLNEMFTDVAINLIKNILTIIGAIVFMACINLRLTGYVLIVMPLVVLLSFAFRYYLRKTHREVRQNLSSLNANLSENLSGMKVIQIYNATLKQKKSFVEQNNKLKRSSLKQILVAAIFRPTIYFLYIATIIIVLWFGAREGLKTMDLAALGAVVALYQYIGNLFDPLQQLAEQFNVLQSGFASGERIFEILDTQSEITDKEDAIELSEIKGEVEFKHVWFAYEKEDWILKDVSFHINPKEVVAFVGATGSGKTTILSLLVRNYDIQKGEILLDGINVKDIKLDSLRSKIGQMLQDVFLFSGTIKSNIKMDDDTISDEEMVAACEYVGASHVIDKLKNGYLEEVRERGNNFSSGERQLLSFARTIVHKPSIMILDEATANIDTETEVLIQHSLEKIMTIGTMLIVAHRLSTIQHADKIIVLDHGKIIEQGNHQELLKAKGHYYDLYRLQYQDEINK